MTDSSCLPTLQAYFEHLDQNGGFFYERWGDAPVHSLAVLMFLNASEVHHFSDIGYRHNRYAPASVQLVSSGGCASTMQTF